MSKALRERECIAVAGSPGRGKTSFSVKLEKVRNEKNILFYTEALNIDDPALKDFKEIKLKDYRGGWAKISSLDVPYKVFLKMVLAYFRDGCIVIDEAALYEMNELSDDMKAIVAQRRRDKLNIDVILLYHGLTQIPIRSIIYVNKVVIFHTADNIDYKKNKLGGFDLLAKAKEEVTRIALPAKPGTKEYYYGKVVKLS